ncbi:VPLPA-CTERM sorting domain-containing protein [uncultured Roseobacter sp.]|uniref:VPLPA-CTERM sorting domain-containing protein n=1 Tax=uncultured Roseobacter sp. TaxID=114847 RepID=UPI0026024840|nr:VPLPA-CTERM sorting domain-containing protein [uncultured Roseobacter sp.]
MRGFFLTVLLLAATIASAPGAVTLTYWGANYEEARYSVSGPSQDPFYTLRGGYSEDDAMKLWVDLDDHLTADTYYFVGSAIPIFTGQAAASGARIVELQRGRVAAHDGVNTFGARHLDGYFRTNIDGLVSEWDFSAYTGTGPDYELIRFGNSIGSFAEYRREYGLAPQPELSSFRFARSAFAVGAESASAHTSRTGTWEVSEVPLPAGVVLLMSALAGFAGLRKASQKKPAAGA